MVVAGAGERQQDVRGLDVAVHEPRGVRGIEPRGDLRDDRRRARRLEPAGAAHERVQVGAVDVAHDEVQPAVLLPGAVDRDDVRVVDRGRHPDLAAEALGEVAVGDPLRARRPSARRGAQARSSRRPVDDAHAAAPRHRFDAAAGEALAWAQVVHASECDRPAATRTPKTLGGRPSALPLRVRGSSLTPTGHRIPPCGPSVNGIVGRRQAPSPARCVPGVGSYDVDASGVHSACTFSPASCTGSGPSRFETT